MAEASRPQLADLPAERAGDSVACTVPVGLLTR